MKLKQVYPKPNNTSIILYYSSNGNEFKYPTGVSITNEKKNGKFTDWDYKLNMVKPYVNNFEVKKKTILELMQKANLILSQHYETGISITPDELRNILATNQKVKSQSINSLLLDQYKEFLEMKRQGFEAKGKIISLKDFNSTKHLLEAFELATNRSFKIGVLGEKKWLHELLNFMRTKQPKQIGDIRIKFQGGLNSKTIKKRFDILSQFSEYLKDLKLLTAEAIDVLKKFRKSEIIVIQGAKETLTIKEIHLLYNHHFDDPKLQAIRDVFVFLCFTGIRFQDLVEFDKKFIKQNSNGEGYVYVKKASKTSLAYNIPLCDIVIEILEKYQYQLPITSNTQSNLYIKQALKEMGIFEEYTEQIDKETGKYKQRYQAITMHKGRDTFITNLIDTTPLNELMKYTGHKKLSTLQGYIDKKRSVSMKYVNVFNLK